MVKHFGGLGRWLRRKLRSQRSNSPAPETLIILLPVAPPTNTLAFGLDSGVDLAALEALSAIRDDRKCATSRLRPRNSSSHTKTIDLCAEHQTHLENNAVYPLTQTDILSGCCLVPIPWGFRCPSVLRSVAVIFSVYVHNFTLCGTVCSRHPVSPIHQHQVAYFALLPAHAAKPSRGAI